MSCETVIGSVVALLDGELSADERRQLESHLAGCRACAREADELRSTREVVARHLASVAARAAAPRFDDAWQRIVDHSARTEREHRATAARQASVSRPGRRLRRRWVVAGTSAGLALAAGLAILVIGPLQRDGTAPPGDTRRVATAVVVPTAPETVAAKPANGTTRVAKNAPSVAESAREQVARRAKPKPGADAKPADAREETVVADAAHEEAVAVNELDAPRELLERPDLFLNYPIVRKLDELRHLDAILADQGADDQPDDGGAG